MTNERGISKKPAFLAAYVTCASVTKAAKAAKIERSLHYRWLIEDAEYAKAFSVARLEAGEILEDEAVRRAADGVLEPLTYQGRYTYPLEAYELDAEGKPTGRVKKGAKPLSIRKYDSGLLMKLLDGFLPNRYGKRKLEVSGENGEPIKLEAAKLRNLTDEELKTLLELARKVASDETEQ